MELRYREVTGQIIKELIAIAGKDNLFTDKDELEAYSRDEMPLAKPHIPQVIVKPTNVRSIARLMKFAHKNRVPVTPRGAGTGLSGGCVPIYGGILLSLERMNKLLEIDQENSVAVVEAGMALSDLCDQVEQQGFAKNEISCRYSSQRRLRLLCWRIAKRDKGKHRQAMWLETWL